MYIMYNTNVLPKPQKYWITAIRGTEVMNLGLQTFIT